MFNNSQKFAIHGGYFNSFTYNVSHDIMSKLKPVENASFKSDRHMPCLMGTRIDVLEKLMRWAKDPYSQPIFWLSGIAGTGKSTISQSFCASLHDQNLLGASFFCSRESEGLRQVERIVPTLAYSLAQHSKEYYDQVAVALKGDPTLASQGIKRQLESLLMCPLKNMHIAESNWHFILVIDALDECEDKDATQDIISILRDMPVEFYAHIHIFISCRPEYYIQQEFERASNKDLFRLHDMESEIVQKDIQLYLRSALYDISEKDVTCLAEQAGKLFIYAFTQVQYLKKAHGPVALQSRVNELLGNKVISKSIDGLYNILLQKIIEDMEVQEKENAKYFINIIVSLSNPLSQHTLSDLWKPCDVASFRSVLNIPESEDAHIQIFHASFPDYILDKGRCHSEFYCSSQVIHQKITLACMQYMNRNLKFNACDMQTGDHVSSFPERQISPGLQYSCKHWISHLTRCGSLEKETLIELEIFVSRCFFFWMEEISILQSMDNAIPGLKSVLSWLQKYGNQGSRIRLLQSFIHEGQRFMQLIASLLKEYPLQLYYSGMTWLPKSSVLHKIKHVPHHVPRILRGLKNTWDMCEVTIRCADGIKCVEFSPDGKQVVSGSSDTTICVWDVSTGKQIHKLDGHSSWVNSVAFSPDGKQVVSGSHDTTVRIWNVAINIQIHQLNGHSYPVNSVAFSPNGKYVVSGSDDSTICIWHVATGKQIRKLEGHSDWVNSVAFSPDGKQVVSASDDNTVCIWHTATGKQIHRLDGHLRPVNSVAFSPDGEQVVSGSDDTTVRIWHVGTGRQIYSMDGHSYYVRSVAFSQNGKLIVSGSSDTTVCIWHVATGKQIHKLDGNSDWVNSVAFSPDGKQVVSGSSDTTVRIWHVATASRQPQTLDGHSNRVNSISFSLDGKQVVSGSHDNTVRIWNVTTGRQIKQLDGHSAKVRSVTFSPDARQVVSGSSDTTVCIWHVATGERIHFLNGHSCPVNSVAFSADGKQVVSGSSDTTVRIWHVATGKQIYRFDHLNRVNSVAFSPDGKQVASGSYNNTVCIWDVVTGQQIEQFDIHSAKLRSVAFSLDARQVVCKLYDGKNQSWNATIEQLKQNIRSNHHISSSNSCLPFFQDGFLQFSNSNILGSLKFWISPQYQDISGITQHGSTVCFGCKSGAMVVVQMNTQSNDKAVQSPISHVLTRVSKSIYKAKNFTL